MPKIAIHSAPERRGVSYPEPFAALGARRLRQKLGNAGVLTDFGVNLTRLPPGQWSSQRHWHSHEDEFVYVLEGEVVLVEDGGEAMLCAGDVAAFPKGNAEGHHMINRSQEDAVYLKIGSRQPEDVTTCSDVDMVSSNTDGLFSTKDGSPFPALATAREPTSPKLLGCVGPTATPAGGRPNSKGGRPLIEG